MSQFGLILRSHATLSFETPASRALRMRVAWRLEGEAQTETLRDGPMVIAPW